MKRFDFYTVDTDIESAARAVESALDMHLVARESSYKGEYFAAISRAGLDVSVQPNFRDREGYLIEPDVAEHLILVYISPGDDDTAAALTAVGAVLVRSVTVE